MKVPKICIIALWFISQVIMLNRAVQGCEWQHTYMTNQSQAAITFDYQVSQSEKSEVSAKALRDAAEKGDLNKTEALLNAGIYVDEPCWNENGGTALTAAALEGKAEVVRLLLKRGANPNVLRGSLTPLMLIALYRDTNLETVRALIEGGTDLEIRDMHGETALILASRQGRTEFVRELINFGVNIHSSSSSSKTTPLMAAAGAGQVSTVKVLLNAGARVNDLQSSGYSALMFASIRGNIEVVKLLIQAGADLSSKNADGNTALSLAKQAGHKEIVHYLKSLQRKGHQ